MGITYTKFAWEGTWYSTMYANIHGLITIDLPRNLSALLSQKTKRQAYIKYDANSSYRAGQVGKLTFVVDISRIHNNTGGSYLELNLNTESPQAISYSCRISDLNTIVIEGDYCSESPLDTGTFKIRLEPMGLGSWSESITDWGGQQDAYAQWEEDEQDRLDDEENIKQKKIKARQQTQQHEKYLADEKRINAEFDTAPKRHRHKPRSSKIND